jgi:hypothetical protein
MAELLELAASAGHFAPGPTLIDFPLHLGIELTHSLPHFRAIGGKPHMMYPTVIHQLSGCS